MVLPGCQAAAKGPTRGDALRALSILERLAAAGGTASPAAALQLSDALLPILAPPAGGGGRCGKRRTDEAAAVRVLRVLAAVWSRAVEAGGVAPPFAIRLPCQDVFRQLSSAPPPALCRCSSFLGCAEGVVSVPCQFTRVWLLFSKSTEICEQHEACTVHQAVRSSRHIAGKSRHSILLPVRERAQTLLSNIERLCLRPSAAVQPK